MEYYLAIKRNRILIPFAEHSQATALFTLQRPRELFSGESKSEDLWSGKYQVQQIVGSILLKTNRNSRAVHMPLGMVNCQLVWAKGCPDN